MTEQELAKFCLKGFFRIDFDDLNLPTEIYRRIDYVSMNSLRIQTFFEMLNGNGYIEFPKEPIARSNKIAIFGIVITIILDVAQYVATNNSQPVIINSITYNQPENNNYEMMFGEIVNDISNEYELNANQADVVQ